MSAQESGRVKKSKKEERFILIKNQEKNIIVKQFNDTTFVWISLIALGVGRKG